MAADPIYLMIGLLLGFIIGFMVSSKMDLPRSVDLSALNSFLRNPTLKIRVKQIKSRSKPKHTEITDAARYMMRGDKKVNSGKSMWHE